MLQLFISIWLVIAIFLSFIKPSQGVALFIAYTIIVPVVRINIGIELGENYVNMVLLLSYIINAKNRGYHTDIKVFMPFIFYYIFSLAIMPFQIDISMEWMLQKWYQQIMLYLTVPFIAYNMMLNDRKCIPLFRSAFVFSIIIAIMYGLLQTTMGGLNPYQQALSEITKPGDYDWQSYYLAEGEGRVFGRISSVFQHPMAFAVFLGMCLIYIYYIRDTFNNRKYYIFLLLCISILSLVCGVRSVIAALIVAIGSYFAISRNFRLIIILAILGLFGYYIIQYIPGMSSYLSSIIDINNSSSEVVGSSYDMRLDQLYGAIFEALRNPIFGLGFDWTHYYRSLYGDHPICLAFESIIYVVICNYGLMGIIIWGGMIVLILHNIIRRKLKEPSVIVAFVVFFVAFDCITGEFGFKSFVMFYIMILGSNFEFNNGKYIYAKNDNIIHK